MTAIGPISMEAIQAAIERIKGSVIRTPLVRLNVPYAPAEIFLKLENLQPMGSFKIRGASNAMALADRGLLGDGVYVASTGNMAQGVAWNANRLGVPCSVIVPENAPENKLSTIRKLGGTIVQLSYDEWWQVLETHRCEGLAGYFIHPVCNADVIAGHGTMGLEILEDLPDVDTVVIPYGGGGLTSGVGSALRAKKPDTKILACEVATASPLFTSLREGRPCSIDYEKTFVEGIGGKSVLPDMWPLVSSLVDEALVVSLQQIVDAINLLIVHHSVIAEGAGAAPVAAALSGMAGEGKIVCIVSGGNIDSDMLKTVLDGRVP